MKERAKVKVWDVLSDACYCSVRAIANQSDEPVSDVSGFLRVLRAKGLAESVQTSRGMVWRKVVDLPWEEVEPYTHAFQIIELET